MGEHPGRRELLELVEWGGEEEGAILLDVGVVLRGRMAFWMKEYNS